MWGRSDVGQLGLSKGEVEKDEMGYVSTVPQMIKRFKANKIEMIALGEAHTLALDWNG